MPYLNRAEAEAYLKNPRIQDLLRVIKFAEGTGDDGPYAKPEVENYSYKMLRGGELFNDLSKHPDHGTPYPGGRPAGFPQFFPWVFEEAAVPLGLKDFSPHSQKLAAIYEADRRLKNFTGRKDGKDLGGLNYILNKGLDKHSINQLSGAWASFPVLGSDGLLSNESMYEDQALEGPKSMKELNRVFNERLNNEAKQREAVQLSNTWLDNISPLLEGLKNMNPFKKEEKKPTVIPPLPPIPDNMGNQWDNY